MELKAAEEREEDRPPRKKQLHVDTGHLASTGEAEEVKTVEKVAPDSPVHEDYEDFELRVKDKWWFRVIEAFRHSSELSEEEAVLLQDHVNLHITSFPLTTAPTAKFLRGLPSTIIILELRNCSLDSASIAQGLFFSNCPSIQSLCLAENLLTDVPFFLDRLKDLRFLDMSYNKLSHSGINSTESNNLDATDAGTVKSTITDKTPLSLAEALQMQNDNQTEGDIRQALAAFRASDINLIYLNLEGNDKLTCHSYYRDMIIATLPSLKALDGHIVCDEELYGAVHGRFQLFPPPFCAGHRNFRVPSSFREEGPDFDLLQEEGEKNEDTVRSAKRKTKMRRAGEGTIMVPVFNDIKTRRLMEIRKHLNVKSALLEQQYRTTSPVVRMQKGVRYWLKWLKYRPLRVFAHLSHLQARVRRFLFVQRCKQDLKATLQAAGEWNEVLDEDIVANTKTMSKKDGERGKDGAQGATTALKKKLKASYHMQAHARTVGLFMRSALMFRRRKKAIIMVQQWLRSLWRQREKNVRYLRSREVRGVVVPAGKQEALLDVLAYFEERRYIRRGSAADNEGEGVVDGEEAAGAQWQYAAESLYEVERVFVRRGKKEWDAVRSKIQSRGLPVNPESVIKRECFHPCGGLGDDERDATQIRLTARRHGLWRLTAQASSEDRALMHSLQQRGCQVQMRPLRLALRKAERKMDANTAKAEQEFPHTLPQALVLVPVPADRMTILSESLQYIRNPRNHYYRPLAEGGLWFDAAVEEEMSAIRLQALWRGARFRKTNCSRVMGKLLSRRAVVCLQRWWRYRNGLGRRLKLLQTVRSVCLSIQEPVMYLDLWSFYWILRQRHLPFLPPELHLFPEMRGTPHVTASGRAVMKGLRDDVANCPQYSSEAKRAADAASDIIARDQAGVVVAVQNDNDTGKEDKRGGADAGAFAGLETQRMDERNYNIKDRARFGLPQWLPHRPLSEEFYRGRHTDGYHKSRYEYEVEYSLYPHRRAKVFPLYDLVARGVEVNLRPVKIPLDKTAGGKEPYSRRWYQDGLHFSPTDADADLRVVELTFTSLHEARARAALLVICTYDYLTHSSVLPMPGTEVKDRVYSLRRDIAVFTQEMMADLSEGKARDGTAVGPLREEKAENEGPASGMQVVAPIEKDILLQTGPLAGWIVRMDYNVWDLMRFRFLCHCLLVCSNTNVTAGEIQQPKVPARVGGAADAERGGLRKPRKQENVRTNDLLTRDVEHSLVSFSDSLYSVGTDSPGPARQRKRGEPEEDAKAGAEGALSLEDSMEGVPVPPELYSEMVEMSRHLEQSMELSEGVEHEKDDGEHSAALDLALGSSQYPHESSTFLASAVVTGRQWSPRDGEAQGLLSESSLERRQLVKVGAAGSSEVPPVPSVPGDASLDGFESEVSGKTGPAAASCKPQPRPERLFEAKRAISPPSIKQLRSVGVAQAPLAGATVRVDSINITTQKFGRSASGPLATNATAGAGAGANSYTVQHHPAADMSTRWKTTAALSYLKSSVWDSAKVMLWCSRGFDHNSTSGGADPVSGGGYASRSSLEDFQHVATSRQAGTKSKSRFLIPVRPNRGNDKERGMNEQKAMVARLEALQLGMYEYAMRLAKLEKVNNANAAATAATAGGGLHRPGDVTPGGTGPGVTAALAHTAALQRNYYSGSTGVADALTGNALHQHDQRLSSDVQPTVPTFPYAQVRKGHTGRGGTEEARTHVAVPSGSPRGSSSSAESGSEYNSVAPGPDAASAAETTLGENNARPLSPRGRELGSPINDSIISASPKRSRSPVLRKQPLSSPEAWTGPTPTPPTNPSASAAAAAGVGKQIAASTSSNNAKSLAMSTSPIRICTVPSVRPESMALEEASAAQEEREREMMQAAMRAREAPKETKDKVLAARVQQKSNAKLRRRFKRRDRAVKSHIKQLQRDDQAMVRQYQRDMHVVKARGRPHMHSTEDWSRPMHTGYTAGAAYANQVANLAADVAGEGLPQLSSTQYSVPSERSGAAAVRPPMRPTKVPARTVHSPVGVGSPAQRQSRSSSDVPTGPPEADGLVHIPARMPPAIREELRDAVSQSQSSMSTFWYSATPKIAGSNINVASASLELGLYFSDVRDAPSGTGRGGGFSPRAGDVSLDNSSGSIYDLSNASAEVDLDSLGIRLDTDPNYADLLAPAELHQRYGSVSGGPSKPAGDKELTAGRPSSGAMRKQQWQQSKKDGASFINALLANAAQAAPILPAAAAASASASASGTPRSVNTGLTGATTLSGRSGKGRVYKELATHFNPASSTGSNARSERGRSRLDREIDLTVVNVAANTAQGGESRLMVESSASQWPEGKDGVPLAAAKKKEKKKAVRGSGGSADSRSRRDSSESVEVGVAHQFLSQRAPKYVVATETPFLPEIN